MCAIVGYTGEQQAAPILLGCLAKSQTRRVDDAGIAVQSGENGMIEVRKTTKTLRELERLTDGGAALFGSCAIAHTRWPNCGKSCEANTHPHCSDHGAVVGVHNGFVENYLELRAQLAQDGCRFCSDTDSEVLVRLTHHYYQCEHMNPVDALIKTIRCARGSNALVVLFRQDPGAIYAVRRQCPLFLGRSGDGSYVTFDVPAIQDRVEMLCYLPESCVARLDTGGFQLFDGNGHELREKLEEVEGP